MRYAYVGLYTLTEAQRAREALKRKKLRSFVVRMPSGPGVSCAYGVRVREIDAAEAVRHLESADFRLGKTIYRSEGRAKDRDIL